jgi:membrane associated rhomboid family serine protease
MLLPIGDTPNPKNYTPWVSWLLIAVNVAIFILVTFPLSGQGVDPRDPLVAEYLQAIRPVLPANVSPIQIVRGLSEYDLFVFAHGYKPGAAEWMDLLFSMFLHGGFAHLLGNMLFLWIYGDNVEHRLGRLRYLAAYLGTGVAASLFFALFAADSLIPMVGASGAISGVLGLYFLLFPRNKVKLFIFLFPFLMETFILPARWVLGIYLVVDNLLPFFIGSQSGVAHGAHIGGFVAGLGIAFAGDRFLWRMPGAMRVAGVHRADPTASPPDPLPLLLRRAIRDNDAERALPLAARCESPALAGLEPAECIRLAGWMEEAGYAVAAGRLLRGCIARHHGDHLAEVYLQLGLLRLRQDQHATAYQHLLDALDQSTDPTTTMRARQALERVTRFQRR